MKNKSKDINVQPLNESNIMNIHLIQDCRESLCLGIGETYNITIGNFYGMTGFG